MIRFMPAVLCAACATASLQAQQPTAFVASPRRLPSAPLPAEQEKPLLSVATGFIYLQTDLDDTPTATASYVMGWYAIPELHLTKHVSVQGDFPSFYNFHAHQPGNTHGFLGGGSYTVNVRKVEVYGFALGGGVRNSTMSTVQWSPALAGGFGMNFKLTHNLAFQVIPGEYVGTHLANGDWETNYTARAGFVFTSFRHHHPVA
jgi:hypothetical protein